MAVRLVESYGDLLAAPKDDRRAHSLAVGRKAEAAAAGIAPALRADLTAAAVLHDIGYGHVETGFHPLDGARFLVRQGFSPVVCNLVLQFPAWSQGQPGRMGPHQASYVAARLAHHHEPHRCLGISRAAACH